MKILMDGALIDVRHLEPKDLKIGTIAQGLARTARFRGQLSRWVSVAEHCVIVSGLVPQEFALSGLLHDAAEFILGDIPGPIKASPEFAEVRKLEDSILDVVDQKWGTNTRCTAVKAADLTARFAEAAAYQEGARLWVPEVYLSRVKGVKPNVPIPEGWGIGSAEARFLERYQELVS